jgi:hypothetical protein
VVEAGGRVRTDVSINDFVTKWSKVDHTPVSTTRAVIDLAVTDPTSHTNLKRPVLQGIAATKYADKKVRESVQKGISAPDIFIPGIIESFGLFHPKLRETLNSLADHLIYKSDLVKEVSEYEKEILKGATLNRFYQLMSVAAIKGVVQCLTRASRRVRIRQGSSTRSTLSRVRGQEIIGGYLRGIGSQLALD